MRVFGIPRTIFVDNGSNPNNATVSVSITQQYFVVPAYSAGYYTITAQDKSTITVESDGGATDLVTLSIYNYDIAPSVWYSRTPFNASEPIKVQGTMAEGDTIALASYNDPVYLAGKSPTGSVKSVAVSAVGHLLVDASVSNAPALQGAYRDKSITLSGVSEQLCAANPNRRVLLINNISANPCAITLENGVAAIGAVGSITIAPGTLLVLDQYPPNGQINIIGTAADIIVSYEG